MLIDARTIEPRASITADVCIVGAGAAGISMALSFLGTTQKVVLLESGGFDYDDRVQELQRGRTTGQRYYPLKSTRLRQFGGSTNHWGGLCSPFEPLAFTRREWVERSGWPISQSDLLPYYAQAEEILGLRDARPARDTWKLDLTTPNLLPLDSSLFYHKLWKLSPPSHLRFGQSQRQSILRADNIDLYTYATATNIRTTEDLGKVSEVEVANHLGRTLRVRARVFILACCAVQNARLLLASNRQIENGIGNGSDLVGRCFMENIEVHGAELWLKKPSTFEPYMWSRQAPQGRLELALTERIQRQMKIANGNLSFVPLRLDKSIDPLIDIWKSEDPRKNAADTGDAYGKADRGRIERALNLGRYGSFSVVLRLEQVPNPLSRVSLDHERDELGVPRVVLNWAFTSLEKTSMRAIYELLGRQVGMAGIGRVRVREELLASRDDSLPAISGGWHHMGTTRMSATPKEGVVDADCRVHGIENLYVAGSSCFPNGAAVNPTLTLMALSLRLAQHLRARLTQGPPIHGSGD
jgi:choline dehydrogenase-like flavoprotein